MEFTVNFNGDSFKYSVSKSLVHITVNALVTNIIKYRNLPRDLSTFYLEHDGKRLCDTDRISDSLVNGAQINLNIQPADVHHIRSPTTFPLASFISVLFDGFPIIKGKESKISIQPVIYITVKDTVNVKIFRASLMTNGGTVCIPDCLQQIGADPSGRIEFQMKRDMFLDYNTDYTLVVRAKPSNILQTFKTTIKFRTAKQTQISHNSLTEISYADVRLMSNNFNRNCDSVGDASAGCIGSGSFGDVFKGLVANLSFKEASNTQNQDDIYGMRVAIKRVKLRQQYKCQQVLETFQRELSVLREPAFFHPNIVRLLAYVPVDNFLRFNEGVVSPDERDILIRSTLNTLDIYPCLIYEYLPLGSLDKLLKSNNLARMLTWKSRLFILLGVAKGLNHLHTAQPGSPAFHRDIKAANIALDFGYFPKLIDCGLAKYHAPDESGVVTALNAVMGTAAYLCPKYKSTGIFEQRSDMYSFGILLFEVMTGKLQGLCSQEGRVDLRLRALEYNSCVDLFVDERCAVCPTNVATQLLQIGLKCTAENINERYVNMAEVIVELERLQLEIAPPQSMEQDTDEQIRVLEAKLESFSLQSDLRYRINLMQEIYQQIENTKQLKECCYEECKRRIVTSSQGITCPVYSFHFYCSDCFSVLINSQLENEDIFRANGYQLLCSECLSGSPQLFTSFSMQNIAKHAHSECFDRFLEVRETAKLKTEQLLRENLLTRCSADQETLALELRNLELSEAGYKYANDMIQLNKHLERFVSADYQQVVNERCVQIEKDRIAEEEKRRESAALHHLQRIEKDILPLHCPHCRGDLSFTETSFAENMCWYHESDKSSGVKSCGHYCCGLCLIPLNDHHLCLRHVKTCLLNPKQGSATVSQIEERHIAHAPKRKEMVAKYLNESILDPIVRQLTLELLRPKLETLKVFI